MSDVAATAFLASAAAHAGFQATVTLVVYPTLSHVRAAHWRQAHDRHTAAILPLVVVVYLALAATGAWWLVTDRSVMAVVAVAPAALAMATTLVAASLHRRLVRRDEAVLARLLGVDRVRTVLALAAVAVAIVALVR